MLPALYPFDSKDKWVSFTNQFLSPSDNEKAAISYLLDRNLAPIFKGPDLALVLGISPKLVSHMAKFPQKYYRTFQIPKGNGSFRNITAPRVFLKTVQRYILDCILSQVPLPESVVGFRRGYNCKSGAKQHIGKHFLWNIDIKDFFPSITKPMVERMFSSLGYPEAGSHFMTDLCCLNDRLPQGAPTSPAISNIIFSPLDISLSKLAHSYQIIYSRYADDLSFSGDNLIPEGFRKNVTALLSQSGFTLQETKSRLMGPAVRREVTGLTINTQVSIPRVKRRNLRAFFHQISLNPSLFIDEKNKATGFASWVYEYHPAEGLQYLRIANNIPDPPLDH